MTDAISKLAALYDSALENLDAAIAIAGLVVSVYINVGGRLWLERRNDRP